MVASVLGPSPNCTSYCLPHMSCSCISLACIRQCAKYSAVEPCQKRIDPYMYVALLVHSMW